MSDSWRAAGPAEPGGSGRRSRRPLILAGVAVAALGSGAGVAVAATSGNASPATPASAIATSPSPSGPQPPGRMFGHGRRPFGGPGFFRGPAGAIAGPLGGLGFFGAVHGQFVVPKSGGGYQTLDIQQGTVTAVSSTSITLKSADGFTKTYTVTSSTLVNAQRSGIGSVKAGNKAVVFATQSGAVATASRIADLTLLAHSFPFGQHGAIQPGASPSPGGTAG
jgi:hypothetical protein